MHMSRNIRESQINYFSPISLAELVCDLQNIFNGLVYLFV